MTGFARPLTRPGGHPPPRRGELPDGTVVDFEVLATEIWNRYRARYPDEEERYGELAAEWCIHDNQHLLNWAVLEVRGYGEMSADVRWLAGVLDARGYPLERLADDLEIAADVVTEHPFAHAADVARSLRRSAELVCSVPGSASGDEPAG